MASKLQLEKLMDHSDVNVDIKPRSQHNLNNDECFTHKSFTANNLGFIVPKVPNYSHLPLTVFCFSPMNYCGMFFFLVPPEPTPPLLGLFARFNARSHLICSTKLMRIDYDAVLMTGHVPQLIFQSTRK